MATRNFIANPAAGISKAFIKVMPTLLMRHRSKTSSCTTTKAVIVNFELFDHTNSGTTHYSTRLNGTTNEQTGLAKSISVMSGDVIKAEVYAKYLDATSSNWTTALTNFMSAITNGTAPAGTVIDGGAIGSTGGVPASFGSLLDKSSETGDAPKTYLNYLVFDRNYKVLDGGFVRVTEAAKENGSDGAHEELFKEIEIKEAGYVYLYLSNDNVALGGSTVEVYFDDFKVEHVKSPVVQVEDYYPFGAVASFYSREGSLENSFKYQSKEYLEDFGLNLYDFEWRQYDPWNVHTTTIDPHAEMFYPLSPYAWAGNNPLLFVDPDGRTIVGVNYAEDRNGEHYDLSIASDDAKIILFSMLLTKEGSKTAKSLATTDTEVTLQLTDKLLIHDKGNGVGESLNGAQIWGKNTENKATLIISTFFFGKKASDITATDIANGITVDTQNKFGQNKTVNKIVDPQIDPREKEWIKRMDELSTGSLYGEINAFSTHEGRHLTPQNLEIDTYPDYEIDAYKVEEATRQQWLSIYGKNASILPPTPLPTQLNNSKKK